MPDLDIKVLDDEKSHLTAKFLGNSQISTKLNIANIFAFPKSHLREPQKEDLSVS